MGKILITGAKGYLGAAVFEALRGRAHVEKLACRLEEIQPGSLEFNVVVHCAGALRQRKEDIQRCNIDGMEAMLKGLAPHCRVIYVSSKSVYAANKHDILSEDAPLEPFDNYGRSKLMGEKMLMESGFSCVILRSGTLFGLGVNNPGMTFPSLAMHNFCSSQEVKLFEPDIMHDYMYVWDLAFLIARLACSYPIITGIYNIAGQARSLHQLIYKMADHVKKTTGFKPVIKKVLGGNPWLNRLDSSKLGKVFGGIAYTDDETIIYRLADYYRQ